MKSTLFTDHADCQVYYCQGCKNTFSPREINATDETRKPPCPDCRITLGEDDSLEQIRMNNAFDHMRNCDIAEAHK